MTFFLTRVFNISVYLYSVEGTYRKSPNEETAVKMFFKAVSKFPHLNKNIMDIKFEPLENRVLIKPIKLEDKSKAGIIIPETKKEKPTEGIVIAVGEGKYSENKSELIPMILKVGDRVLFREFSPDRIKYNGEDYFFLRESEVIGRVTGIKIEDELRVVTSQESF